MANTLRTLLLFVTGIIATCGYAQFHVDVVMPPIDKDFRYEFEDISCNGVNCIASARLDDFTKQGYIILFFRSTDGGLTWKKQDPGFPRQGLTNYTFRRVQQIDSLNIIAIADSGLILRSYDAGNTWEEIKPRPTSLNLNYVHFSDPLNGILVPTCDSLCSQIFTTKDGGKNWTFVNAPLTYSGTGFHIAQCFAEGHYAVMPKGNEAPIFLTADNWQTVKRIATINEGVDSARFSYRDCKISLTQDTILLSGQYFGPFENFPFYNAGVVRRSINGGTTWEEPFLVKETGSLNRLTIFGRDTLVAMGPLSEDTIYVSTNYGGNWSTQILEGDFIFEDSTFPIMGSYGIASSSGGVVSILGFGTQNLIAYHPFTTSSVERGRTFYTHRIYPNPVQDGILNIVSIEESTPYRITDMLGRVILNGMVGDKVDISVNVSHLSPGIYFVYVDDLRNGRPIRVGKVTLLHQ